MVHGVVGKLGGGKSLTMVFYMLKWLKQGYIVVSNIHLKEEFCKENKIPLDNYKEIDFTGLDPWKFPHGSLRGSGGSMRVKIVIDEAGEWCDSYSDARHKGQLSDIASWLRQSDKLGQDVYFIVQFETLLHARLRSIVHRWITCQDLAKFRFPLVNIPLPPPLNRFCVASTFDTVGKDLISRQYILKSDVYCAYDTSAFFGESYKSSLNAEEVAYSNSIKDDKVNLVWVFVLLFLFHFFF